MAKEKEECIYCSIRICGKARERFLELKSFEVRGGNKFSNERIVNKLISLLPDEVLNGYIGGKK